MIIAGVDASINSTGVVLLELHDHNYDSFRVDYLGFTQVKKHESINILHYSKKDFKTYMEQNLWMRSKIMEFCKDAEYIAIEDYAYAASGKVFHIAEFSGLLKHRMYASKKNIRLYDPLTIKMFATTKGSADKIRMVDEFDTNTSWQTKPDIDFLIDKNRASSKYDSPRSDLVDAYFIAKLLQLELSFKSGRQKISSFVGNNRVEEIFTRKTKGNPIALIDRDFYCFG